MSAAAIRVQGVGKRFRLGPVQTSFPTLRDAITASTRRAGALMFSPLRSFRERTRADTFWALRDVSFEVEQGEVVGIIGSNGAGKSTLLKILSRITEPTAGRIEIWGRVGSLLEVGTGFHPELSGRENTFLNGAILGMHRHEIARKFDEIVAFAEVERFIDMPVKHYSSGMYLRLAFAVAAHLEPEILIVDEVLAVGDAAFQKKCLGKMGAVARDGRTVVFVSHNMGAVQMLCRSALLLSAGRVVASGPTGQVVAEHLRLSGQTSIVPIPDRTDRSGSGRVRFHSLSLHGPAGDAREFVSTGEDACLRVRLVAAESVPLSSPLDVAVIIRDSHDQVLTTLASFFAGGSPGHIEPACELQCVVPRFPLLAGEYRVDLWCAISNDVQDHLLNAATLRVEPGLFFEDTVDARMPRAAYHGPFVMPQHWSSGSFADGKAGTCIETGGDR
jgi:lipopolysaccharide transport system ATP-binding protein